MPASARNTPNANASQADAGTAPQPDAVAAAQTTTAAASTGHAELIPAGSTQEPDAALAGLVPVADLLGRLGAELADRAAAVERLQPLAAGLTGARAARTDPAALRALQGLDLTEQTLRALAGLLADLAATVPADWRIDARQALAAITLADLANRLGGTPGQPHDAEADGDCDFF